MFKGSHYLEEFFSEKNRKNIFLSFEKILKDKVYGDFDAVACRGTSGLLVAPMLADKFGLNLIIVRKPGENSHCQRSVECDDNISKYIIIDDFAYTGATIESIVNGIKTYHHNFSYIGCYFWTHNWMPTISKQKEIIANNSYHRYTKYCKDKVFAQRVSDKYSLDNFKGWE